MHRLVLAGLCLQAASGLQCARPSSQSLRRPSSRCLRTGAATLPAGGVVSDEAAAVVVGGASSPKADLAEMLELAAAAAPAAAPPSAEVLAMLESAAAPAKESLVDRYPLLVKSLSMGITYGLADGAAQIFGRVAHGEVVPLALRLRRGISLMGVGCLAVGPLLAVWFDFLERAIPGKRKRAVAARTALDQTIQTPFMISVIFALSSLAEGHSLAFCGEKISTKLLSTWRSCAGVWTPISLANQGLVPLKYRVFVQAIASFFWDAYLSIVSHAAV